MLTVGHYPQNQPVTLETTADPLFACKWLRAHATTEIDCQVTGSHQRTQ